MDWKMLLLQLCCGLGILVVPRIDDVTAFFSSSPRNPVLFAEEQLRSVLATRGVSCVGVSETNQLFSLLISSGPWTIFEVAEATAAAADFDVPDGSSFEVEENWSVKSGLLVVRQVRPKRSTTNGSIPVPPSDDLERKRVRDDLIRAARTGPFYCLLDPKICEMDRWIKIGNWLQKRQFVMRLPPGNYLQSAMVIPRVATHQLTSRLQRIENSTELEKIWLQFDHHHHNNNDDGSHHLSTAVRIVLLLPRPTNDGTRMVEPPLFFAALSAQFNGRVSFGVLNVVHAAPLFQQLTHLKHQSTFSASYVIITPEAIFEYGKRWNERLTFEALELRIKSLQPEINDVFFPAFLTLNFLSVFYAVIYHDNYYYYWRRLIIVIIMNLMLYLLWSSINYILRFDKLLYHPETTYISKIMLKLIRQFSAMKIMSCVRNDYVFWKCHPWLLIGILIIVGMAAARCRCCHLTLIRHVRNGNDDLRREANILRRTRRMRIARGQLRDNELALLLDEVVSNLPVRRHRCSPVEPQEENDPRCTICLRYYSNRDNICDLPCGHNYHEMCVKPWILIHPHRCPICRASIIPAAGD